MDTKNKESFVMYDSFIQAGEFLSAEDFKKYILKIRDYALYGDETPSDNQVVNALMIMAKPNLKAAEERRQKAIENGIKGKEFGSLGGAPKKGETREEYDKRRLSRTLQEPLNNPQITPNEPLNVNVDDNVNVNENEEVKVNEEVDGNEKVNAVGVNDNHESSPSSVSSSSSSSLSSDSSFTSDSIEHIVNKDTKSPTDISKEEYLEKYSNSSGGSADSDGGMSAMEYLKEIYINSCGVLVKYRLNNITFDADYKKAYNNATHAQMNMYGKTYEEAKEIVEDTVKGALEIAKQRQSK